MYERMRGVDAYYLHFEDDRVRAHTLKCLILDPSALGRQLTLADVSAAIEPRLALQPRARQRAMRARFLPGSGVWVNDPGFELANHLAEETLDEPSRPALDRLAGRLATVRLPMNRPLWDATLVHGLPRDMQAVIFRVHHAVSDGIAAANMLDEFSTAEPSAATPVPDDDWTADVLPTEADLRKLALAAAPDYAKRAATFGRELVGKRSAWRRTVRDVRQRDDLLGASPTADYGWTGPKLGHERLCASAHLSLADIRAVKEAHGVTVNTVLLALVGEALRAEAVARGQTDPPCQVASTSVAIDPDSDRVVGNDLSPVFVKLHTDEPDLGRRLARIARSSTDAARNARAVLQGRTVRAADLAARAAPVAVRLADGRTKTMNGNAVVANVRGPAEQRWFGPVRLVDFLSWAILVPPIGVNLTMYSYDGQVSVGLLTAPEVTDEPYVFLGRLHTALDDLTATI